MSCIPSEHRNEAKHALVELLEAICDNNSTVDDYMKVIEGTTRALDYLKRGEAPAENTRNHYYETLLDVYGTYLSKLVKLQLKILKVIGTEPSRTDIEEIARDAAAGHFEYRDIYRGTTYRSISECDKERQVVKDIYNRLAPTAGAKLNREFRRIKEGMERLLDKMHLRNTRKASASLANSLQGRLNTIMNRNTAFRSMSSGEQLSHLEERFKKITGRSAGGGRRRTRRLRNAQV